MSTKTYQKVESCKVSPEPLSPSETTLPAPSAAPHKICAPVPSPTFLPFSRLTPAVLQFLSHSRRPHHGLGFLARGGGGADTDPFSLVTSGRTCGNGMKLCQGTFRFNIRSRFPQRVAEHWKPGKQSHHRTCQSSVFGQCSWAQRVILDIALCKVALSYPCESLQVV